MKFYELSKFVREHFPDADQKMFLDPHNYKHMYPHIQFVEDDGSIIPPWNSKLTNFSFIGDIPFFHSPISLLKISASPGNTGTFIRACIDIDGISHEFWPIYICSPHVDNILELEGLDVPKIYLNTDMVKG